jgi:hypothetical protein
MSASGAVNFKGMDMWKKLFHKQSLASSPAKVELPSQESSPPWKDQAHVKLTGETSAPASPSGHMFHPPEETRTDSLSDDALINRFEPLLEHGPRNIKILTIMAEAYARKLMFDKALSYYQRALEIGGAKRADIEQASAETMLKKIDFELSQLDPKSPDFAVQRERIQNQRQESQWQEMEKVR